LVHLGNSSSTLVNLQIASTNGWPPPGGVLYALLTAPVGTTDLHRFTPTVVLGTNFVLPGRVASWQTTITNWPVGETRAFAIVGWFADLGTNFNMAWIGQGCKTGIGCSAIGTWQPPPLLPPSVFRPFEVLGSGFTISGPLSPELCPVILQSPISQSVTQGARVTFSVTASPADPQFSLEYRWNFNGLVLVGETSNVLVLTNVQQAQTGAYFVTVQQSPPYNSIISSTIAMLEVYPDPHNVPWITRQPSSQTAESGDDLCLSVSAIGAWPMTFQWYFNATNAMTAPGDNPSLCLSNVQVSSMGAYSVVLSNAFSSVTSAPAMLGVVPSVNRRVVSGIILNAQSGSLLSVEYGPSPNSTQDWESDPTLYLVLDSPEIHYDITSPPPLQRFYRAQQIFQVEPESIPPTLDIHLIPALTLTGNSGEKVRVDAIKRYGPTDAWFTLDTVTLTNTSQLYLDKSAVGQPQRLYRLVPVP